VSDEKQPPLPGMSASQRANKVSKKASKARRRLPVLQPSLVPDSGYLPKAGVPRTRADCPVERPCPFVRCRQHLWMEDAAHRAGRPGLSSVPRDERGLTIATTGQAGSERPGTTLRPAWLSVRGLEIEREVKVYVGAEMELHEVRAGALEYWLAHLRMGEPVLVFDDDSGEQVARARLTRDGLALDRELPPGVVSSSSAVVLTRVRGVPSCALDEIDMHGRMSNEQVGDRVARHRTLIGREIKSALAKAIANAEAMGMTSEDLLRGLREMGGGASA
jgi:hypothetical protein